MPIDIPNIGKLTDFKLYPIEFLEFNDFKEESRLDFLFNKSNKWTIKTKPDNCFFSALDSDYNDFIINNLKESSGNENFFAVSDLFKVDFDENALYKLYFFIKAFSPNKTHINLNCSIFIHYFDENKKQIHREKKQINLNNNNIFENRSVELNLSFQYKYLSIGIFLNKLWNVKLSLSNAYLYVSRLSRLKFAVTKDKNKIIYSNNKIQYSLNSSFDKEQNSISLQYQIDIKSTIRIHSSSIKVDIYDNFFKYIFRDLEWKESILNEKIYIDNLTPKIVSFPSKNFGFIGSNNFDSLEISSDSNKTKLKFNLISVNDRPNVIFNQNREKVTSFYEELIQKSSFTYLITVKLEKIIPIFSSRVKGYKEAVLCLSHHADATTNESFRAVMFGSSDQKDSIFKQKGLVKNKLKVTWSIFYKSLKPFNDGLDNPEFKNSIKEADTMEYILHTVTPDKQDDRQAVEEALERMTEFNAKNWIDHSLASGKESSGLKSKGWDKTSEFYIIPLLKKYNYFAAWSYIDNVPEGINQLNISKKESCNAILFRSSNLEGLWQWSTYRPKIGGGMFDMFTDEALISLIKERGISLLHEYFAHIKVQKDHFFIIKENKVVISNKLENLFQKISIFVDQKELWNPTVSDYIEYIEYIQKVYVSYTKTCIIIKNNNLYPMKEYSLWAYKDLKHLYTTNGIQLESEDDSNGEYKKFTFELDIGITILYYEI